MIVEYLAWWFNIGITRRDWPHWCTRCDGFWAFCSCDSKMMRYVTESDVRKILLRELGGTL